MDLKMLETKANIWEIQNQISEKVRHSQGFLRVPEFSQTLPWFSSDYESKEKVFYFSYKI